MARKGIAMGATKPPRQSQPLTKEEIRSVRVYAEIVRRKGLSVEDVQRLPAHPLWYVVLTWNEREEKSWQRWFRSWSMRTLGISARAFEHDRWVWALTFGLHRRDICMDPEDAHNEAREADLPRAKWLPVKQAMVALPRDLWPTR